MIQWKMRDQNFAYDPLIARKCLEELRAKSKTRSIYDYTYTLI